MSRAFRTALGVAAGLGLLAGAWALQASVRVDAALDAVAGLGPWGPVLFVGLSVLAVVLFVPSLVLSLAAGALFGFVLGLPLTLMGGTLGAVAAFSIGRHLARERVARALVGNATFRALNRAAGARGWRIVALARLTPIFPFAIGNYGFGLSPMSTRAYGLASLLGSLPSNAVYVYAGSLSGSLAAATAEGRERTPAEWALLLGGLLATVALAVYLRRIATRELAREVPGS
jgi:uncharacterized membrane protein YdjX (TVP38/TMEM64 family)